MNALSLSEVIESDKAIHKICHRAVEMLYHDIYTCIIEMLDRNDMGSLSSHLEDIRSSCHLHLAASADYYACEIEGRTCMVGAGRRGRELCIASAVTKGQVLLREHPVLALPLMVCSHHPDDGGATSSTADGGAAPCGAGSLLTQHVHLAWILAASASLDPSLSLYSSFLHTFRPPQASSAPAAPSPRPQDSTAACAIATSRVPYDVQGASNCSGWSTKQQVVMSTVCAVVSLLTSRSDRDGSGSCVLDSWRMYEALIRIPHNSHAMHVIHQHTRGSGGMSDVGQQRVALGLFPLASALNHSCAPVAAFRHLVSSPLPWPQRSTYNIYFEEEVYRSCSIETVATRAMPPGAEVCVSYGPTAALSVCTRQKLLREAYCFDCHCDLCVKQLQSQARHSDGDSCGETGGQAAPIGAELEAHCLQDLKRLSTRLKDCQKSSAEAQELPSLLQQLTAMGCTLQTIPIVSCGDGMSSRLDLQSMWARLLCLCLDLLGEGAARRGEHRAAMHFVERAIALMTDPTANPLAVPTDDVVIARERVKLVELLYASGEPLRAYAMARQVRADLCAHVDVDSDPDYLEMTNLIRCVEG